MLWLVGMPHRLVFTYNPAPFRAERPEEPTMAIGTLERRHAELSMGRVAYLRHGSGPPLVLVHGIPTSARLWEPLLGLLGERYDCIVPDLLGLGRSLPNMDADLSSPGQADMIAALLDHLEIPETLLVLHDQGGAHGMELLARHGERVRAVAFTNVVCFDNWPVPSIDWIMRLGKVSPTALELLARTRLLQIGLRIFPLPQTLCRGPVPKAAFDDWMDAPNRGGEPLEAWRRYVVSQSARHTIEATGTLRAWTKPAVVVWGAHDRFLPVSFAARLAREIPGAPDDPKLLPFAGHFWQLEVPRTGGRVLREFLDSVA